MSKNNLEICHSSLGFGIFHQRRMANWVNEKLKQFIFFIMRVIFHIDPAWNSLRSFLRGKHELYVE